MPHDFYNILVGHEASKSLTRFLVSLTIAKFVGLGNSNHF